VLFRSPNVEDLYRWQIINAKAIKKLNIILALIDAVPVKLICQRFNVSNQYVYKIRRKALQSGR
jgi:hypothetical protein